MGALGSDIVFPDAEQSKGRSINELLTINGGSGSFWTGFMSCVMGLSSLSRAINEAMAVSMLTY